MCHSVCISFLCVVGFATAGGAVAQNSAPLQSAEHPQETSTSSVPRGTTPARQLHPPDIEYPGGTPSPFPEGTVTLRVRVNEQGTVDSAVVEHSLNPELDATANAAALRWKFISATENGKPVPSEVSVDVEFVRPHPYIAANGIYRIGGRVTPPHAIYAPDPDYTQAARQARIAGNVVLWFVVNAEGRTEHIRVAKSLDPGLDKNAIDAVRTWKFEPSRKDGHTVAVMINVEIHHKLY